MEKNMGSTDKTFRIVIAIIIAILCFTKVFTGTFAIIMSVLAVIFLLTSFLNFCPLYLPFGINTCKTKKQNNHGTARN